MTAGKTIALTRWTFVGKVMSLLLNMLSRFVIAFLPRSKHLVVSWLWSPSTEILEPKKIRSIIVSIFSPSICDEIIASDTMILGFWMVSFKPDFHFPLSPSSRDCLVPFCFLPFGRWHLLIWGYWYFSWKSWFQLEIHPVQHFAWCALHIRKGNGNPLQYSCLENLLDRGAWQATVHGVAKSQAWVVTFTSLYSIKKAFPFFNFFLYFFSFVDSD